MEACFFQCSNGIKWAICLKVLWFVILFSFSGHVIRTTPMIWSLISHRNLVSILLCAHSYHKNDLTWENLNFVFVVQRPPELEQYSMKTAVNLIHSRFPRPKLSPKRLWFPTAFIAWLAPSIFTMQDRLLITTYIRLDFHQYNIVNITITPMLD